MSQFIQQLFKKEDLKVLDLKKKKKKRLGRLGVK